jgi:hypothetical protein
MPEHHTGTERHQAVRLGRSSRGLGDPETLRGPPYQRQVAGWVRRSDEQQASRVAREPGQPPREALLDLRRQGQRRGQTKPARELGRGQAARQLEQGERVPPRRGNETLQYPLIQPSRQEGLQQRARIAISQGPHLQFRYSRERVAQLARREQERDLLRQEAAGHKCKRARRRTIEPLRVIDHTEERPFLGGLR